MVALSRTTVLGFSTDMCISHALELESHMNQKNPYMADFRAVDKKDQT
jgi:hypothetical protein